MFLQIRFLSLIFRMERSLLINYNYYILQGWLNYLPKSYILFITNMNKFNDIIFIPSTTKIFGSRTQNIVTLIFILHKAVIKK